MKVLLLGGTAEARELAARLERLGVPFVSSLAGRVSQPRLPAGEVRMGGFGGSEGLLSYLRENAVTELIDATHPFAATMTQNAYVATQSAGIPLIRYARPGWSTRPDALGWHWAPTLPEVFRIAGALGARPFLTSGRQTLGAFAGWADRDVLVRVVEPVDRPVPPRWTVIHDRGPYDVPGEVELMHRERIDVLVTKDSGGEYTSAKLDAATELEIPVVALSRPLLPQRLDEVSSVDACVALLLHRSA